MSIDKDFVELFNTISERVFDVNVNNGWWNNEDADELDRAAEQASNTFDVKRVANKLRRRNDAELIALMHSELSEALEAMRHGDLPSDHIPDFSGVEEEFADVIIRIMDTAHARGYRVADAIIAKIEFNKSRGYRHGGKKF